jgi:hypothetical protein
MQNPKPQGEESFYKIFNTWLAPMLVGIQALILCKWHEGESLTTLISVFVMLLSNWLLQAYLPSLRILVMSVDPHTYEDALLQICKCISLIFNDETRLCVHWLASKQNIMIDHIKY